MAKRPRVLARNPLPGGSSASPAIADGSLFVRATERLFRIDKESAREAEAEPDLAAPGAGDEEES